MADEKTEYPDYPELVRRLVAVESSMPIGGGRWVPTDLELRLQILHIVNAAHDPREIGAEALVAEAGVVLDWLKKGAA